jgi:hypothetical protein
MARLEDCKTSFNAAQLTSLEQRMTLLTSFMDPNTMGVSQGCPRFAAGQLSVVDLSDPFIDPTSACGLFEIITRLFVRADVGTGKVLVVDEAHKVCPLCYSETRLFDITSKVSFCGEQRELRAHKFFADLDPRAAALGHASHHQHARLVTCQYTFTELK